MDSEKLAFSIGLTAAFLIGVYCGVFGGEASVIYQCEKDSVVTIKGAFWKTETKYSCTKPITEE
jgi:hypothetical protein